jgi:hypothetical protein
MVCYLLQMQACFAHTAHTDPLLAGSAAVLLYKMFTAHKVIKNCVVTRCTGLGTHASTAVATLVDAIMSQVVQLYDDQMPEGLDEVLWLRFVELRDARARLDLAVRQQTAQVTTWGSPCFLFAIFGRRAC